MEIEEEIVALEERLITLENKDRWTAADASAAAAIQRRIDALKKAAKENQ